MRRAPASLALTRASAFADGRGVAPAAGLLTLLLISP
jgi:hypothetical protein